MKLKQEKISYHFFFTTHIMIKKKLNNTEPNRTTAQESNSVYGKKNFFLLIFKFQSFRYDIKQTKMDKIENH